MSTNPHTLGPAIGVLRESADPLDQAVAELLAEVHFACLETPASVLAAAVGCAEVVNDVAGTQDREQQWRDSFDPAGSATGGRQRPGDSCAALATVAPITRRQRPEPSVSGGDAS